MVVQYLNAFCPHCRATHNRLSRVLSEVQEPLRKRRVYTWASNDYPLWARACAFAQTAGLEERMFEELMRARNQGSTEIYAAAKRAGLDVRRMRTALSDPRPPRRLVRDRQLVSRARITKLPTLDIGRRRLMGEQSEAELRDAVTVALTTLAQ
jgi:predicted DsbA family dithiol-disulfide isomerase